MLTVLDRVTKLVAAQLHIEEKNVKPEVSFTEDLNADSLDLIELIIAFEEEFSKNGQSFEIADKDTEKITTVQQVVDYLKEKGIQD